MTAETSDVVEHVSPVGMSETLDRLTAVIANAGLTLFARIDHAAGAHEAGLSMPPATMLIYGNPKGGTPLMVAAPRLALDLPLRVLVREGDDGRAIVVFHPAAAMLRAAGVPEPMATRLDPAQRILVEAIGA